MMTEGMLLKKKKATKWLEQEMFNVKMVKRRERQFIKMEVKRWKGMFNNKTKIQKVSPKNFRTLLNDMKCKYNIHRIIIPRSIANNYSWLGMLYYMDIILY